MGDLGVFWGEGFLQHCLDLPLCWFRTIASQLMLCRQKKHTLTVKSVDCKLKTGSVEKLGVG